ncbi:MAG TPA: hypothetical protein VKE40_27915 [Gemmataceae bacterium]|nr:hypothetical protein [Gemmataceae bacterium]
MSRSARIARAVTIGYGYQAVVALTGLVLTPVLLGELGTIDYGRWLSVGQVLALLGLLDLGVTAVLPREVAAAAGSAGRDLAAVVNRAAWLVWLQMPLVTVVATGVWAGVTAARPELAGPLAVILGGFVVQFPLRVPGAVLTGLQDLTFGGVVQAGTWAVATAVSVSLVLAGCGLYGLAVGWAAGQLAGCAACWARLRTRFPSVGGPGGWPGRAALAGGLAPSGWTSVRQVALLLLNGVDLIVLGWVAGPTVVVVYACTVKLVAVVNNQPYLIGTTALPALAELQAGEDRVRVWRACRAAGLGMMLLSGGLTIAVLAVSAAFVPRWVGPEQFGGPALVLLAVLAMVARHFVYALNQAVFALGYDRRLAVAALADGVVTVAAMVAWVTAFGAIGVPLGSLTGLVLTSGASAVVTLATAQGVSAAGAVRWAVPWLIRFVAVAGPVAAVSFTPAAAEPAVAGGLLVGGLTAYAAVVLSLFAHEPLAGYRAAAISSIRRWIRGPVH